MTTARYDGHADWYHEIFPRPLDEDAAALTGMLGPGTGQVCLDLACGTGRHLPVIAAAGYRPLGIDLSADQLRIARRGAQHDGQRSGHGLTRADARALPLPAASVDAAVGAYFHTDVEDFPAVVAEVARCLRPGGRFAYVGVHPCFVGMFVDRVTEARDGVLSFRPGYGTRGWAQRSAPGSMGLSTRVGFHHKTLEAFLGAFTGAGLHLTDIEEMPGSGTVLPRDIAVAAIRPQPG
jgi:SAM-dependent methyltransferase